MVRVAVSNGNPIPLTLTLPRGEGTAAAASIVREVRRADTALGFAEKQRSLRPLPQGEGRGEGKRDARCAKRISISSEVHTSPEGPYPDVSGFIISCLRFCWRKGLFRELSADRPGRQGCGVDIDVK